MLALLLRAALAGAAAAAVVNLAYLLITGETASMLATLLWGEALTLTWSLGEAIRFRRKWRAVKDSYNCPALGEGIDIPGRPPTDD